MAPPRAICCIICPEIPSRKAFKAEQVRIDQRRLAVTLAPAQPERQSDERQHADREDGTDVLPALLPDQDGQHDAAHAEDGEDGGPGIEGSRAGVRRVLDQLDGPTGRPR